MQRWRELKPYRQRKASVNRRNQKERRAQRETGAPFFFRKTRFFRTNLTATRNYCVVGDIPTQSGSELLPAIGRRSNPTHAISDALTLTQHQRKVTTRFWMELVTRFKRSSLGLLPDDLSRFERRLADRSKLVSSIWE